VDHLARVRAELEKYEHLLLAFSAHRDEQGRLELVIELKSPVEGAHTYRAPIHPRDVEYSQFPWTFQKYLYDCLHDYLVELFLLNPQMTDNYRR
jgi:hypothetical protein